MKQNQSKSSTTQDIAIQRVIPVHLFAITKDKTHTETQVKTKLLGNI